jgi:hypothetical protein
VVKSAPTTPEPTKPEPTKPEPTKPAAAKPDQAKPAAAKPPTAKPAAPAKPALVKLSDRKARKAAKKLVERAQPKAPRSVPTSVAAAAAAHARAAVAGTAPSSPSIASTPSTDVGPLPALDWRVIANQLTHAVQGIPPIPLVAQTMADELAASSGAHVAVMVRDDRGCWRVEGGAGLRSFEWAQTIDDDHWLVMAGRQEHPSLMVMDTDVVRSDLIGAPLASRLQLVRTHSTRSSFFVCAGWDDNGNDTGRVAMVVETVRRHGLAMSDAIGLRSFTLWLSGRVDGLQGLQAVQGLQSVDGASHG